MFSKRGNTLERHFRANLRQYFPQNRQFFFARAFGARGILAIRWWGKRAKNEPSVRKRSWRILSISGRMSDYESQYTVPGTEWTTRQSEY